MLVGHRSDFKVRWMATQLHLLTVAVPEEVVTAGHVQAFTASAWDQMVARKGQLRGLQTGVAVFPTVVGTTVEPEAARWAAEKQRVKFATFARPVVVDATTGQVSAFTGNAGMGGIYNGHLKDRLRTYFPGV